MNKKILISGLFVLLMFAVCVSAVDFSPSGDINLKDRHGIYGALFLNISGSLNTNSSITTTDNITASWIDADTLSENVKNPPSACTLYSAVTGFNTNFSVATCMDSWVNIDGDTMTGNLNMGGNEITNVNSTTTTYLSGHTVTGDVDMDGNIQNNSKIINPDLSSFEFVSRKDLIAEWDFNQYSGTNLPDMSGNGNNCTLVNFAMNSTSGWESGLYDYSVITDGKNDYVDCGYNTDFHQYNISTINMWIKTSSDDTTFPLISMFYRWTRGYRIVKIGNELHFSYSNGSNNYIEKTDYNFFTNSDGNWIMGTFVINYDNGTVTLYRDSVYNGLLNLSSTGITYDIATESHLYLLRESTDYGLAEVDNVKIYDRLLSQSEITNLYHTDSISPKYDITQGGWFTGITVHAWGTLDCWAWANGTIGACRSFNGNLTDETY